MQSSESSFKQRNCFSCSSHQDFFPVTRIRACSSQDSVFQSPGFVFPVRQVPVHRIRFSSHQDSFFQSSGVAFPVISVRFSSTQYSFFQYTEFELPVIRIRDSSTQDSFFPKKTRIRFSSRQDSFFQSPVFAVPPTGLTCQPPRLWSRARPSEIQFLLSRLRSIKKSMNCAKAVSFL